MRSCIFETDPRTKGLCFCLPVILGTWKGGVGYALCVVVVFLIVDTVQSDLEQKHGKRSLLVRGLCKLNFGTVWTDVDMRGSRYGTTRRIEI